VQIHPARGREDTWAQEGFQNAIKENSKLILMGNYFLTLRGSWRISFVPGSLSGILRLSRRVQSLS
jgi:hypothetical protein